jgi:hypothetical protein
MSKRPKGKQGSWFATINEESLPVLKKEYWIGRDTYHEPYSGYLETNQGRRYLQALQQGRALLASYVDGKRKSTSRDIFKIANVTYSPEDGLRLTFTGREPA